MSDITMEPGTKGHNAPKFLCITPQILSQCTQNVAVPIRQASRKVWIRFPDGHIDSVMGFKMASIITGLAEGKIKGHMDKWWNYNNEHGWQFASSRDIAEAMRPKEKKPPKSSYVRSTNPETIKHSGIKVLIIYGNRKKVECKSIAEASRVAHCNKETITKYLDRKWTSNNRRGIQFKSL